VRKLSFLDIVETALDYEHPTHVSIELIRMMQNAIEMAQSGQNPNFQAICSELDYMQLFSLLVLKRDISLLRFMFTLPPS
jgi:hypothetical protein